MRELVALKVFSFCKQLRCFKKARKRRQQSSSNIQVWLLCFSLSLGTFLIHSKLLKMRNSVPMVKDLFCNLIDIPKTRKSLARGFQRDSLNNVFNAFCGFIHEFANSTAVSLVCYAAIFLCRHATLLPTTYSVVTQRFGEECCVTTLKTAV